MDFINYWAVLAATVAAFILGGVWYSPLLFLKVWCREEGKDMHPNKQDKHSPIVFLIAFILFYAAALGFAIILGPTPALKTALIKGIYVGFLFVATSFGINYVFASRSIKLFLIDAGYHILQFALYGLIIGFWTA